MNRIQRKGIEPILLAIDSGELATMRRNRSLALLWILAVLRLDSVVLADETAQAEDFVRRNIGKDGGADLSKSEIPKAERILSGAFLVDILTRPDAKGGGEQASGIPPRIQVSHAVVRGNVDVQARDIVREVLLSDLIFESDVDLERSHFYKSLHLDRCEFRKAANFPAVRVDGTMSVFGTTFHREAIFAVANIGVDLIASGASFLYLRQAASSNPTARALAGAVETEARRFFAENVSATFRGMHVGNRLLLEKSTFNENCILIAARIDNGVSGKGCKFFGQPDSVTFYGASVGSDIDLTESFFSGRMSFVNLRAGGALDVEKAQFFSTADFRFMNVSSFNVDGTTFLSSPAARLADSKYQFIKRSPDFLGDHSVSNVSDNEALIQFLNMSDATSDTYADLEAFARRANAPDFANQIGMAWRARQRATLSWHSPWYWTSLILHAVVADGFHPEWALVWAAAFVIVGCFVFAPGRMQPQDGGTSGLSEWSYSRFWYSLDLFLPVIDLIAASRWMPRRTSRIKTYMRIHRIAGWIIVPLGLLALAGIFKN
jgi:hypothetical protein